MKKILLIAAASIFSTAAFATDLPARMPVKAYAPAPVATWNGCYAGIAGGWGWADITGTGLDGGNVGGTLGCNVQVNNWVYGIEGDALWSDMNITAPGLFTAKQDFLGSVRGRLGVLLSPNALLYGTGGLGVGHIDINGIGLNPSFDDTHTGWVAGAGIEWVVAQNWTAKVEYLHYDFHVNGGALGSANYDVDAVRVGLNYQFGR